MNAESHGRGRSDKHKAKMTFVKNACLPFQPFLHRLFLSDSSVIQSLSSLETLFDEFWAMPYANTEDNFFAELEQRIQEPISIPDEPESAPNFRKFSLLSSLKYPFPAYFSKR